MRAKYLPTLECPWGHQELGIEKWPKYPQNLGHKS